MVGEIAILNVSAGDTKLTFDPKDKAETRRASAVVADLIRRGFAIMVEVGRNERGPLYQRVKKFDPKTAEYIIIGAPEETPTSEQEPSGTPRRKAGGSQGRARQERRLPAASHKAVAVAPTAGG